jgi:hypothetical protein
MTTRVQRITAAAVAAAAFLLLTACATTRVDRHAGIDRTGKKCSDCHPKGVKKGSPAASGATSAPAQAPSGAPGGGSGSAYDMNTRGQ